MEDSWSNRWIRWWVADRQLGGWVSGWVAGNDRITDNPVEKQSELFAHDDSSVRSEQLEQRLRVSIHGRNKAATEI